MQEKAIEFIRKYRGTIFIIGTIFVFLSNCVFVFINDGSVFSKAMLIAMTVLGIVYFVPIAIMRDSGDIGDTTN